MWNMLLIDRMKYVVFYLETFIYSANELWSKFSYIIFLIIVFLGLQNKMLQF